MMQYQSVIYYRNRLPQSGQLAYDSLMQQWMKMGQQIHLADRSAPMKEMAQFILLDYPMIFYVDYYRMEYTISSAGICMGGRYLYSREEAQRLFKMCEDWGRSVTNRIPDWWDKQRKAQWLQEYLADLVEYDKSSRNAYNLVGVVQDQRAVCEGISKAYKDLCDLAGLTCIVAIGTLEGQPHAWNKLWLDGRQGFVDVTAALNRRHGTRQLFLTPGDLQRNYQWDKKLF